MSAKSAVVWRGLGYGVGAAVGLVTVIVLALVATTLPERLEGAPFVLSFWPVLAVFGMVNAALPGLAVGVVLARGLERSPGSVGRGRAALAAGGTYFAQVIAVAVATDGKGWTASAVVGAVVAALLAALCARRVLGRAATAGRAPGGAVGAVGPVVVGEPGAASA
ncbi:hypothetical protein VM98_28735 [Streptomyces rubellomurinus subsp. indigoferus]|nr:hypothetical protein VM98_28735 [Streptomyces rubellomurinus subsp. indigoferus]